MKVTVNIEITIDTELESVTVNYVNPNKEYTKKRDLDNQRLADCFCRLFTDGLKESRSIFSKDQNPS